MVLALNRMPQSAGRVQVLTLLERWARTSSLTIMPCLEDRTPSRVLIVLLPSVIGTQPAQRTYQDIKAMPVN